MNNPDRTGDPLLSSLEKLVYIMNWGKRFNSLGGKQIMSFLRRLKALYEYEISPEGTNARERAAKAGVKILGAEDHEALGTQGIIAGQSAAASSGTQRRKKKAIEEGEAGMNFASFPQGAARTHANSRDDERERRRRKQKEKQTAAEMQAEEDTLLKGGANYFTNELNLIRRDAKQAGYDQEREKADSILSIGLQLVLFCCDMLGEYRNIRGETQAHKKMVDALSMQSAVVAAAPAKAGKSNTRSKLGTLGRGKSRQKVSSGAFAPEEPAEPAPLEVGAPTGVTKRSPEEAMELLRKAAAAAGMDTSALGP